MNYYWMLMIPALMLFVGCGMEPDGEELIIEHPIESVEQELGPIGERLLDNRYCRTDDDCSDGMSCDEGAFCYRESGCRPLEPCIEQCVGICRRMPLQR